MAASSLIFISEDSQVPVKRPSEGDGSKTTEKRKILFSQHLEDLKNAARATLLMLAGIKMTVDGLPDDIRQRNLNVLASWKVVLDLAAGECPYHQWPEVAKKKLDTRLDAPEQFGLQDWNEAFSEFSALMEKVRDELPSPSEFAKPGGWPAAQEAYPILCLRPAKAKGLPLSTLHDVFRQFLRDVSNPFAMSSPKEAVAARIAASKLCQQMGNSFTEEDKRSTAFDSCVAGLLTTKAQHILRPQTRDYRYGKVDGVILEDGIAVALREDKLEPGSGDSDVYMQIARDYDLLVKVLLEQAEGQGGSPHSEKARAFIEHGAPCFLICVLGPLLFVCGGFYDGHKPIIQPLGSPVFMLDDTARDCRTQVATLLLALTKGISTLTKLVNQPRPTTPFPPFTPRLYGSCTFFDNRKVTLTFKSKLRGTDRLFYATLHPDIGSTQPVIVKLVPGPYSEGVHRFMAEKHMAPELYGHSKVDGAPNAYIMEDLELSKWSTLHQLFKRNSVLPSDTRLHGALRSVVETLASGGYVHGDLRPNNIMARIDESADRIDVKVIDFDWAGKADEVYYPAERNHAIKWPGQAGGPISQGDDKQLIESWLGLDLA